MNSPKEVFKLIEGHTEQISMHNRINAINRINFLVGENFDLRKKDKLYRYLLDMEMYQRWYKNEPKDKVIDEEYCQRAAEVLRAMENDSIDIKESLEGITERVGEAFKQHENLPLKEKEICKSMTYQTKKENCSKKGFMKSFLEKLKRK